MKRRILNVLMALTVCLTILIPRVGAKSPSNWYCVHTANHQRPRVDAALSYIEKYDGYYIAPEQQGNVVYLTFDAGYENGNVARVLDAMREQSVTGAFFILGHLAESEPALVRRMADEGHLVCNHTYSHKDMTACDAHALADELGRLEAACRTSADVTVAKYFRPPEGKFSVEMLDAASALGYKTVFWSFAYADWDNKNQPSADAAKKKILDNVHNGAVILLHPTSKTNADILQDVIRTLKSEGYRFGTLDELTRG
jgi:peptidoglycan-N-acetylmuramic acid deacetylase